MLNCAGIVPKYPLLSMYLCYRVYSTPSEVELSIQFGNGQLAEFKFINRARNLVRLYCGTQVAFASNALTESALVR
jgi:hypothetical protein